MVRSPLFWLKLYNRRDFKPANSLNRGLLERKWGLKEERNAKIALLDSFNLLQLNILNYEFITLLVIIRHDDYWCFGVELL